MEECAVCKRRARIKSKPFRLKGAILLTALVVSLVCFLCADFVSKNDMSMDLTVGISGASAVLLLFTGGAYQADIADFGRLSVPVPAVISALALVCLLTIVAVTVFFLLRYLLATEGAERRLERISGAVAAGGGALLIGVYVYFLFSKTPTVDFTGNAVPLYSVFEGKVGLLLIGAAFLLLGLLEWKLRLETMPKVRRYAVIYGFMAIPLALILVFNLYPVLLQTVLSFKEFNLGQGVFGSPWVGLKHFKFIFSDPEMLYVIGNTLYISLIRLVVGVIPPLLLSVFLYDLKSNRARGIIQNIVYIPHFFSWVIIYAISYAFFNTKGMVSTLFGTEVNYLTDNGAFLPIVILTAVWKELGWGTILYLAALTGVDTELFDAAKIDGAGPLQRIFHITLPSIMNVVIFLTIMNLGNILKNAGGEQLLLFANPIVKRQALVIDTWLYWTSMGEFQYSLGAAMSFFQAAIGMVLVLTCNWASKKTTGVGMW